jgi:SAM-dependent methyltransferase
MYECTYLQKLSTDQEVKMSNTRKIQKIVKETYGSIARSPSSSSCCGSYPAGADDIAQSIGYSQDEIGTVPDQANLGLGCGNPTAIAALKPGETVLDLGSGAGFDCFLAARKVGGEGRVIGVDMTTEMIEKAKSNAAAAGSDADNVEFRLGEIEKLPVEDASIDVVISNCVINLSADKEAVFREIARVLKPGGRVAVSDIVLLGELPAELKDDVEAYTGCISGAIRIEKYRAAMEAAGLKDVNVTAKDISGYVELMENKPLAASAACCLGDDWKDKLPVTSAYIEATR